MENQGIGEGPGRELKSPLITVGITTFDRTELLRAAVQSVLDQSFSDFEVLVSNDNPANLATPRLGALADSPKVRVLEQPANLGVIDNMNHLLASANGLWFTWLSDDDLLSPDFLAIAMLQINAAGEENCVGFFPSFTTDLAELHGEHVESVVAGELLSPADVLAEIAKGEIRTVGSAGVMSTGILRSIGGMTPLGTDFFPYCDTLIPLKLSTEGGVILSRAELYGLRLHGGSESASSKNLTAFFQAQEDFLMETKSLKIALPEKRRRALLGTLIVRFQREAMAVARRETNPIYKTKRIASVLRTSRRKAMLANVYYIDVLLPALELIWKSIRRK